MYTTGFPQDQVPPMRRLALVLALALMAPAPPGMVRAKSGPAPFSLTVDSIMRGADLVGYPPTNLRWSADSRQLYFDWRKPKEKEPSTCVASREGGEPRKLSDEYKRILKLFEDNLRTARNGKNT